MSTRHDYFVHNYDRVAPDLRIDYLPPHAAEFLASLMEAYKREVASLQRRSEEVARLKARKSSAVRNKLARIARETYRRRRRG